MQKQRFFILSLSIFLFINLFFFDTQNLNAIPFNFGGQNANLEQSYSSQASSNSWLDSVFDCVLNFGDCAYKGTEKVAINLYQKIGEIYFGIEPVKVETVDVSGDIKIGGENIGDVKIESLKDLNNDEDYSKIGLDDVLDKENSNFETAEKEIKDKLLALDKQIQDIKSDPNKTSQEKNSEIANLNTSLKAEQQKITDLKAEKEALTSGEKYTPEFNRSAQQAQAYVPPQPGSAEYNKLQNVMNQNGLQGSPDFYDGKFVCDTSGTGLFATNEKPRNQGGKVANELYYAIANAAKVSGVNVVSVGCYNFRTIAGSNNLSKHANGDACDVLPKGEDAKKTAFLVLFLANTGNFNTVGSYADRKFDHSHLGADCGGTWCPYQKGSGLEPWKELAFRTVFQVCGQQFNPSNRPSKSFVQNCAKKAAETFCKKQAGV